MEWAAPAVVTACGSPLAMGPHDTTRRAYLLIPSLGTPDAESRRRARPARGPRGKNHEKKNERPPNFDLDYAMVAHLVPHGTPAGPMCCPPPIKPAFRLPMEASGTRTGDADSGWVMCEIDMRIDAGDVREASLALGLSAWATAMGAHASRTFGCRSRLLSMRAFAFCGQEPLPWPPSEEADRLDDVRCRYIKVLCTLSRPTGGTDRAPDAGTYLAVGQWMWQEDMSQMCAPSHPCHIVRLARSLMRRAPATDRGPSAEVSVPRGGTDGRDFCASRLTLDATGRCLRCAGFGGRCVHALVASEPYYRAALDAVHVADETRPLMDALVAAGPCLVLADDTGGMPVRASPSVVSLSLAGDHLAVPPGFAPAVPLLGVRLAPPSLRTFVAADSGGRLALRCAHVRGGDGGVACTFCNDLAPTEIVALRYRTAHRFDTRPSGAPAPPSCAAPGDGDDDDIGDTIPLDEGHGAEDSENDDSEKDRAPCCVCCHDEQEAASCSNASCRTVRARSLRERVRDAASHEGPPGPAPAETAPSHGARASRRAVERRQRRRAKAAEAASSTVSDLVTNPTRGAHPETVHRCARASGCPSTGRRLCTDTDRAVRIVCDAGCIVWYHRSCWRAVKTTSDINDVMPSGMRRCPTPDCWGSVSRIESSRPCARGRIVVGWSAPTRPKRTMPQRAAAGMESGGQATRETPNAHDTTRHASHKGKEEADADHAENSPGESTATDGLVPLAVSLERGKPDGIERSPDTRHVTNEIAYVVTGCRSRLASPKSRRALRRPQVKGQRARALLTAQITRAVLDGDDAPALPNAGPNGTNPRGPLVPPLCDIDFGGVDRALPWTGDDALWPEFFRIPIAASVQPTERHGAPK